MKPVYFQGLKKRPFFDEIVGYLETQQQMMKYPDRTATRIKDSHYFTNLDGQGGMSLADQAEKVQKERLMQEMIRQNVEHHYIGSDGARTPPAPIHTPIGSDIPNLYTPLGRTPAYTPSFVSAQENNDEFFDWERLTDQEFALQD